MPQHAFRLVQCTVYARQDTVVMDVFPLFCNCLPVDKWVGQCCTGFKCRSPSPGTSMDGFCINGTLQWINRNGLASRQVVKGRWGWEAGRGRTGFILSRNAFQCVSGEQELPSTLNRQQTHCRRAKYATTASVILILILGVSHYQIHIVVLISLSTWPVKTV